MGREGGKLVYSLLRQRLLHRYRDIDAVYAAVHLS